jgi:hypothetical protein
MLVLVGDAARSSGFEKGALIKGTRKEVHVIAHPLCKYQFNRVYNSSSANSQLNRTAQDGDLHPHCREEARSSEGEEEEFGDDLDGDQKKKEGMGKVQPASVRRKSARKATPKPRKTPKPTKQDTTLHDDIQPAPMNSKQQLAIPFVIGDTGIKGQLYLCGGCHREFGWPGTLSHS